MPSHLAPVDRVMGPLTRRQDCVSGDPNHLEVRCYHTLAAAAGLREDINALNLAAARPDPFSTFEFLESFLANDESEAPHSTLWLLTAGRAGRLLGYVALRHVRKTLLGMQGSTIGFAVTHDTDRPHIVARAEHGGEVSEAFMQYLLTRKREWGLLEFQQQDDASPFASLTGVVTGHGLAMREWPSLANGTIHLRWRTFPEYLRALTKKNRLNVGRQIRLLLAAGEIEILTSSDPAVTPAMLELYRTIEPRSWKFTANATIGRHPRRIAYFRSLVEPSQPMRVSIHLLLLDGVPIAGLICGSFVDGLYALHIVYDANLTAAAPGSLMLLMGIRYAIERRAAFFNLLSGFGYFKSRWLATMTEARTVQVFRKDRPLFWRRLGGDSLRWALRAASAKAPATFNPARRAALIPAAAEADSAASQHLQIDATERVRVDALLGQARRGKTETTSALDLVALWPKGPAVAPLPASAPVQKSAFHCSH